MYSYVKNRKSCIDCTRILSKSSIIQKQPRFCFFHSQMYFELVADFFPSKAQGLESGSNFILNAVGSTVTSFIIAQILKKKDPALALTAPNVTMNFASNLIREISPPISVEALQYAYSFQNKDFKKMLEDPKSSTSSYAISYGLAAAIYTALLYPINRIQQHRFPESKRPTDGTFRSAMNAMTYNTIFGTTFGASLGFFRSTMPAIPKNRFEKIFYPAYNLCRSVLVANLVTMPISPCFPTLNDGFRVSLQTSF